MLSIRGWGKTERPKPPRCLYQSWIHYLLRVVSPAKIGQYRTSIAYKEVWGISLNPQEVKAKRYFEADEEYYLRGLEKKLYNRIMTREEYRFYKAYHGKRLDSRV